MGKMKHNKSKEIDGVEYTITGDTILSGPGVSAGTKKATECKSKEIEELREMLQRNFGTNKKSNEVFMFMLKAVEQAKKELLQELKEKLPKKLIAKEFLGWEEKEFEEGIDTSDDLAELREFRMWNACIEEVNQIIDNI